MAIGWVPRVLGALAIACVLFGSAAQAQPAPGIVAHAIVLTPRANGATLAMELSQDTPFEISTMARPDRIVIDLPKVAFAPVAGKPTTRTGPVSAFRYGLFIADRSRIVLDLAEPALVERVDTAEVDGRKRLIFHFARVDRARFVEAAGRDARRRTGAATASAPAQEEMRGNTPLVVIDPGHGGIDGGAVTADGDQEKTIVLALALAVKQRLEDSGKVKVALSRSDDTFVSLGDRVRFARDRKADLMVSLHADKLVYEKGVRGASVYTVSERASDVISAKLADSENAADQAAGIEHVEDTSVIGDILFDLTKRETRIASVGFARQLATALPQATSMHKTPLRAAGFKVLTAPEVPSVLIETGYLSSAEDARMMKTDEWRRRMADAIANAVEKFLGENATRLTNSAARP
jgi:N-acetylmuramoyl-L-alanine amidase